MNPKQIFKKEWCWSSLASWAYLHLREEYLLNLQHLDQSGSSAGKESACNAGGPGSIPGFRRSPGEGIGYPLQYTWAFPLAQTVKNFPAMRETWVRSLSWEDPLEEGMATHSSILAESHGQRSLVGYSPHGCKKSDTTEWLSTHTNKLGLWMCSQNGTNSNMEDLL